MLIIKINIGNTALILSVLAEDVDSVRLLLDAGADVDIRNNKREQEINLADPGDNKTMAELLRKHKKEKKLFGDI